MTLTALEGEEIINACIRSAVGWTGLISGANTLKQVGVKDDEGINALVDEIVTNASVGVPSKEHEIKPDSLDLGTGTTVAAAQNQVIENAFVP